jgi:hypothetical protein
MVALWSRNWKGKILCTSQIINDSPTGWWEYLAHLPFSPDLAHQDYFCGSWKHFEEHFRDEMNAEVCQQLQTLWNWMCGYIVWTGASNGMNKWRNTRSVHAEVMNISVACLQMFFIAEPPT